MKLARSLLIVLGLLLPLPAFAQDSSEVRPRDDARPPKNVLSVQLMSLVNSGLAVQYERFLAPPRVSFVTGIGFRSSGGPDIEVLETSFGAEGRVWLVGKAPFSKFEGPAMVGPYLGVRLDGGFTKVTDEGHVLGTSYRISESLMLGVRFSFARRFEATPSMGFGLRTDIDPRGDLAPWTRLELFRLGLTLGVMF
jgi:hypothetical protein